jgi:hypothetical protein
MCVDAPAPEEANVSFPGDCFAVAMISATLFKRRIGADDEHVGNGGDVGDVLEVGSRVVGHPFVQRIVDRHHAGGRHEQRVPVRRRLGDGVGADVACGPGLVLDHDGLAERTRKTVGQEPRKNVGRASGRERDDDAHRPLRISILGVRRCHAKHEGAEQGEDFSHDGAIHTCTRPLPARVGLTYRYLPHLLDAARTH